MLTVDETCGRLVLFDIGCRTVLLEYPTISWQGIGCGLSIDFPWKRIHSRLRIGLREGCGVFVPSDPAGSIMFENLLMTNVTVHMQRGRQPHTNHDPSTAQALRGRTGRRLGVC
jgi:hypothetical protein